VVFRGDEVLVMRNPDGVHVLPGGQREVLEEAGWGIEVGQVVGCIHFLHLGPRSPALILPYPEFVQIVFLTEAARYLPRARLQGDYETDAEFRPVSEARMLDLSPGIRLFLDAALRLREGG